MFTGLIQGLGYVQVVNDYQLKVQCDSQTAASIMQGLEIGDSVAVDGACLTVEKILAPQGFTVSVSPETLAKTTLGQRSPTDPVNLETSLRVGSKLGGHFVTGHVDGQGVLESAARSATSWNLRFGVTAAALHPYILPKGSIAVNGVSLTIADCDDTGHWFSVAVIPHTYALTNLEALAIGSAVNLEGDILGKYVQRLLRQPTSVPAAAGGSLDDGMAIAPVSGIDPAFLLEHGYA